MTVAPWLDDGDAVLYHGDCLEVLRSLPNRSVHMCATSPPFYGLRDYGTGEWEGGNPDCDHIKAVRRPQRDASGVFVGRDLGTRGQQGYAAASGVNIPYGETCGKCGARRVDQQIGLEETPDEWVSRLVAVFREVRRVLRDDGTLWVEIGDRYSSQGGERVYGSSDGEVGRRDAAGRRFMSTKPKDLVGQPWLLAFALRQPYYTGRITDERDRVWLAAMIDAEGTICGSRHVRPDGNVRTQAFVFLTNSDERLLAEADRIWPGARYKEHLKVGDQVLGATATRDCWRWQIQGAEDKHLLLRELYPHLIGKKRQALVAYNMLEITLAAKRLGRGGESKQTKERRDYLARTLSDLNQRRPVDLPGWLKEPESVFEPGWYLRSEIVWSKSNPMPESVTDRPTKAHSTVFLLSKRPRYFYDADAIREPLQPASIERGKYGHSSFGKSQFNGSPTDERHQEGKAVAKVADLQNPAGANARSVWTIPTEPTPFAHFATWPRKLVARMIQAGTSERGCCPECGAPWVRQTTSELVKSPKHSTGSVARGRGEGTDVNGWAGEQYPRLNRHVTTLGWKPACSCPTEGENSLPWNPVPCTVLDPFAGSGTTLLVARHHGRHSIGIELNEQYLQIAAGRLAQLSLLTGAGA